MTGEKWWKSTTDPSASVLTREDIDKAIKIIESRVIVPHGTKDNPHIVHPSAMIRGHGICHECGTLVKTK